MQSLGSSSSTSNDNTAAGRFSMFRISGPGMLVFIIAFVVAVIFAANQNDVVGWIVAIIAGFWLALASFVVFSIQKAAKKAGARLNEAQNAFNAAASGCVQVQVRVVEQERAKGDAADRDTISRALETIEITATNARDMIKSSGGDDAPVSGTIID